MKWVLKLSFVVSIIAFSVATMLLAEANAGFICIYEHVLKGVPQPVLTDWYLSGGYYLMLIPIVFSACGLFIPVKDKVVVPVVYLFSCWLAGFIIVALSVWAYGTPFIEPMYRLGTP